MCWNLGTRKCKRAIVTSVHCPKLYFVHVKHQEDDVCLTLLLNCREVRMCNTSLEVPYGTVLQLASQFLLYGVHDTCI